MKSNTFLGRYEEEESKKNGEITFREFIWAFQGWIATEEDDEI